MTGVSTLHAQNASSGKADAKANTDAKKQAQFVSSNWKLGCQPNAATNKMVCQLSKEITDVKSRQLLLRVSIGAAPYPMVLQLPHGLALANGIHLQVDKKKQISLPLYTSSPKGLFTRANLSAATLKEMSGGKNMKVILAAINGRKIVIPISLAGFSIAFDKLK